MGQGLDEKPLLFLPPEKEPKRVPASTHKTQLEAENFITRLRLNNKILFPPQDAFYKWVKAGLTS